MLKFGEANAKTKRLHNVVAFKGQVYSFDLPSGYTCPGAKNCKSMAVVDPLTGRATIKDGPDCQFRCFSASQEVLFPATRKARQYNLDSLLGLTIQGMTSLILESIPSDAGVIRLHVGGDFFSVNYLRAWLEVAAIRPNLLIYAYTKSLHFIQAIIPQVGDSLDLASGVLLPNFRIVASRGGKYDHLISELGIREAIVVMSENETSLPIDHTDEHALLPGGSFALLIHGTQPKGTPSAKAAYALRKRGGINSYKR